MRPHSVRYGRVRFNSAQEYEETPAAALISGISSRVARDRPILLRAAAGIALLVQGGFYLGEPTPAPGTWAVGLTALVAGILLLIGCLTPIAGTVGGLGAIGTALSLLPACTPTLFDAKLTVILAATMLLAIVLLGPGAFSIDACVYGRREIIIPPSSSQAQK